MKIPKYTELKSYIKELTFNNAHCPEIFFTVGNEAIVNVELDTSCRSYSDSLINIDLCAKICCCSKQTEKQEDNLFELSVVYSRLIGIDEQADELSIKHLMKAVIPQSMFESLRTIVTDITKVSGFPPVTLSDCTFTSGLEESFVDNEDDDISSNIDSSASISDSNIFPLGYNWLIEDIRQNSTGADLLDSLADDCGFNFAIYEDTPLYKYFLRFLKPIAYKHPECGDCCDPTYWDFLYQLLFAGADVEIQHNGEELPDLVCTFNGTKCKISEMTLTELKGLTSCLGIMAVRYLIEICQQDIDEDYYLSMCTNDFITSENFRSLFCCDCDDTSDDESGAAQLANQLSLRIAQSELQSMLYQLETI